LTVVLELFRRGIAVNWRRFLGDEGGGKEEGTVGSDGVQMERPFGIEREWGRRFPRRRF
jgi:hypothetical protein